MAPASKSSSTPLLWAQESILDRARYDSTIFFFSSRRRHTRCSRDWSSDVCSSDLLNDHIHVEFLRIHKSPIGARSAQGNLQELEPIRVRRVKREFSFHALVLAQISPGPASIADKGLHVVIVFVSRVLAIGEETYRPGVSPRWSTLLQRFLEREQHLSRLGHGVDPV